MCINCFEEEILSFKSQNDWLKFDLELTKKLGNQNLKYIGFKGDGLRDKDDGEYFYQCRHCKEIWKLKEPGYYFSGYFKKSI